MAPITLKIGFKCSPTFRCMPLSRDKLSTWLPTQQECAKLFSSFSSRLFSDLSLSSSFQASSSFYLFFFPLLMLLMLKVNKWREVVFLALSTRNSEVIGKTKCCSTVPGFESLPIKRQLAETCEKRNIDVQVVWTFASGMGKWEGEWQKLTLWEGPGWFLG